ncbi:MAG: hypothetical protein JNJ92_01575 [Altererythrobacter sp.]|nr:hypothetical protein [Altererythrobacter sp.]
MGGIGVVAVLLLIGLASIIKDRATQTESTSVAGAAASTSNTPSATAGDPLAEAGVVPVISATPSASRTPPPAVAEPAAASADAR